jgi:hypothetical protein
MSYKPDEKDWMAYLYGELEGPDKEKMDQYLLHHADARAEFESFSQLRSMMSEIEDKEVIAPPLVVGDSRQRFLWHIPYFRMIVSIAASLLLIIVVGRLTGLRIGISGNEFRLGFGEAKPAVQQQAQPVPSLSAAEIQQMISASLEQNNTAMQDQWKGSQQKLNASIRRNLDVTSARIDQLVQQAATASQDQIRQYVTGIQTQNERMVKDYFALSSGEQKRYIEDLLVDFSQYLQQQRTNDLQLVQTQLNSLQHNTNAFKQETEEILSSIITSVGTSAGPKEIKN